MADPLVAVPLPPPLETSHLLGAFTSSGEPPVGLTDQLYFVGWSRTNRIATLEKRHEGEFPRAILSVVDLVGDEVLAKKTWESWEDDDDAELWWQNHQSEIAPLLNQYAIEAIDYQLGVFPLILDNEFYTLVLQEQVRREDLGRISRLTAIVNSTGRGTKTIWSRDGYWQWAQFVGFVPSPFENRLALVFLVQPTGWQGTHEPLRFLLAGMSLKAGFPKP